ACSSSSLPSCSPELSPDELVWRHVKHHTVGRQSIIGPDQFRQLVLSTLLQLQRLPHLNRGLFYERSVRYAL
ncbi:MAG TPA: IS630 family transposase, partial [Candidatus Nitrosotalea sp.]|nr:IS630 family transposase [Candidatus Nitrosotalea sp.]